MVPSWEELSVVSENSKESETVTYETDKREGEDEEEGDNVEEEEEEASAEEGEEEEEREEDESEAGSGPGEEEEEEEEEQQEEGDKPTSRVAVPLRGIRAIPEHEAALWFMCWDNVDYEATREQVPFEWEAAMADYEEPDPVPEHQPEQDCALPSPEPELDDVIESAFPAPEAAASPESEEDR